MWFISGNGCYYGVRFNNYLLTVKNKIKFYKLKVDNEINVKNYAIIYEA